MPHEPRKFIDKEHAEMMVYALEEHFLAISTLLDLDKVPAETKDGETLTVYQRVWIMSNFPITYKMDGMPEDEEGEDPETIAEKIWDLYHPASGDHA